MGKYSVNNPPLPPAIRARVVRAVLGHDLYQQEHGFEEDDEEGGWYDELLGGHGVIHNALKPRRTMMLDRQQEEPVQDDFLLSIEDPRAQTMSAISALLGL